MIRGREVRRMAAILCMITGMTAVPAYAAAPETFGAVRDGIRSRESGTTLWKTVPGAQIL